MNIKTTRNIFSSSLFFIALFGGANTVSAATLILSPSTGTISVGQTISVDIMLDTQGAAIDGVDVYSLHYDPSILEVQDVNSLTSGVQITPGSLLQITLTNRVVNGLVQFSQVVSGGTNYTGAGKLATITLKGLANGASTVTFDFTPGSTSDSNVAGGATDKLTSVGNGSYSVGNGTAQDIPTTPITTTGSNTTFVPSGLTEAQIQAILSLLASFDVEQATLANVTAVLRGTSVGASAGFTRDLKLGMTGSDVRTLQQYLNAHGYIVAVTGAGSSGNETMYFGTATRNALSRYQTAHNITPAAGYFGPLTRAKISGL